ncbi:IclR family transcriptional regulator [Rhizobium sp. Root1204]|uniref:IclR family transcriptional regulator n=1 Tax=Rhizobium sp. Root1204 TaxID=1736428 RepID=UPI000715E954|nr:IclR family transcriptional regulator [Rhizobium sp. Root1204]KQV41343.1 hypothetical protein ASC96_18810 [Rhizobium sp. Root1204]
MVNGRGVQSIDVGGRILTALVQSGKPLMLKDLSAMADIAPAQAHAYLISFRRMDLVEQDSDTGRYLLGPFALHLGLGRMRAFSPMKLASKAAVQLAHETRLRALVGVWGSHGPISVQIEEGEEDLHIDSRPGKHHSLIKTATGKVFAAYLPRSVVEPQLQIELERWDKAQFVGEAPTMREVVQTMEATRARGFAFTKDDPSPGIASISAPVFDQSGQIQFTLAIVGATRNIDLSVDGQHVRGLLRFTRSLSEELGFQSTYSSMDIGTEGVKSGTRRTAKKMKTEEVALAGGPKKRGRKRTVSSEI